MLAVGLVAYPNSHSADADWSQMETARFRQFPATVRFGDASAARFSVVPERGDERAERSVGLPSATT